MVLQRQRARSVELRPSRRAAGNRVRDKTREIIRERESPRCQTLEGDTSGAGHTSG